MLEWTIVATSGCSLPTHLPVVEIELCLRAGTQREKGACSCLLFSVANENDHPRDICSRGRINPERQPSLRAVMAPFAFGIFIPRWNVSVAFVSQIIRIFFSIYSS